MSFSAMGLATAVLKGIASSGLTTPTEIQRKAIPPVLHGMDIIGCAPTGTGKTAAFVLPMLSILHTHQNRSRNGRPPMCLILTPTREIAQQIDDAIKGFGKHTNLQSMAIYGGTGLNTQLATLKKGIDIITATPGRLMDHMKRKSVDLSHISILILDEADRMFDMGFINAVRTIMSTIPTKRQTLLFSATMSREVRELTASIQKKPVLIEIGKPFSPAQTVEQYFFRIPQQDKMELLLHILNKNELDTMLVFARTKHGADKITRKLMHSGITSAAIHSNRSQSQRRQALEGFKKRKFKVLVATDIAARGIDVSEISYVVNYDTPVFAEDYIHRIGRTGRAEAKGTALTFVSKDEEKHVKKIEYLTGKSFDMKRYPGFVSTQPNIKAGNTLNTTAIKKEIHAAGKTFIKHKQRAKKDAHAVRTSNSR
jgi:ATP-dependent RNA helicase RhlE